jgi:hypothetical protein
MHLLQFLSYLFNYDLYGPVRNVFDACRSITGQVGGDWALKIESFLGPVKWHRAERRVPFWAQKLEIHYWTSGRGVGP